MSSLLIIPDFSTPEPNVKISIICSKFLDSLEDNLVLYKHGHPESIFGKYLFRRRFEVREFSFGTVVVKFRACLPLLGFSNIYKMV